MHCGYISIESNLTCPCRLWDIGRPIVPLVETVSHHSEFTFGLDFSTLAPGKVSGTGMEQPA